MQLCPDILKKLLRKHRTDRSPGLEEKLLIFSICLVITVTLPFFHFGVVYRLWDPGKPLVNQSTCTCGCFDTIFSGRYDRPPSRYKHIYFNATSNSLRIWFLAVLGILISYETIKYIIPLIKRKQLRNSMFALLLSTIYPHYYGWWVFFNYINEGFYSQWYHQLFFTITESISTALVIHLCNIYNRVQSWKLLLIININVMHLIVGGFDLFLMQLIYRGSFMFENVRNLGLLVPDLFHVLVCFFEIQDMAARRKVPVPSLFYKEEIMMFVLVLTLLSILGRTL